MGRVEGKVAIVTGAGSAGPGIGNGKAAAIVYAREGARVLLVDRDADAAHATRAAIEAESGTCHVFCGDVSRTDDCLAMTDECVTAFGAIDILHNNVATPGQPGGPIEVDEDAWDDTFTVNVKSVYLAMKYALPHMVAQGSGAIVNISSVAAVRARLGRPNIAYSASKAAIEALSREVAIHYARHGIRSNTILLGGVATPRIVAERPGVDVDRLLRERGAKLPSGRLGDGFDAAYAALFLASDEAKHITGTTLAVDGGQSAFISVAIVEGADGGGAATR